MSLRDHFSRRIGWYLFATGLLLLILLWDWNWFRPLVERQLSAQLDRPVTLEHFDVDPGRVTTIELRGLAIANPRDFPEAEADAARLDRLSVRVDVRSLFHRRLRLESLEIDAPQAALQQLADGRNNLPLPPKKDNPPSPNPWTVDVLRLAIRDGQFHWQDAKTGADIRGTVATKSATGQSEDRVVAHAEGRYNKQPFEADFTGGSILTLRDASAPYPVDFNARSGETRISLRGTLLDPAQLAGARLKLSLQGKNIADLYPLVPVALPATPAYSLTGALDYARGAIFFKNFSGIVGSSDLGGTIAFTPGKPRHRLDADLRSKKVVMADLAGFIGGTPGEQGTANDTPELAAKRQQKEATGRVLPSDPINIPKLRLADVHMHYIGQRIEGEKQPLDDFDATLDIVDGNIKVSPLKFGVGEGRIEIYATLDDDGKEPRLDVLANLKRLDVSQLLASLGKAYKGDGRLGGKVEIKTRGKSVADWLGRGDGRAQLFMSGGDFSAVLLDLAGLDLGNAVVSALGIPSRTRINCLVADMPLENGLLKADTVLLDTGSANLKVNGSLSFADESLDLRAFTEPKRPNIGRLKAPINIRGTFQKPSVLPDLPQLGLRAGAAVALGTLLTPLAALLPTLQLGLGDDADCQALIDQSQLAPAVKNAAPKP